MVIMTPIALIVCKKLDINPLIGALCADMGGQVGSNFMISLNGVIYRNLITNEGFSSNLAFVISISIFIVYLIMSFLIICGLMIFSNRKRKKIVGDNMDLQAFAATKGKTEDTFISLQKSKPFDKNQKINLILISIFVIVLLVWPILHLIVPKSATITFVNSKVDVGLIAIIFAIIAFILHLGDEKSIVGKIPWNTLFMISGVGMLMGVAVQAGTIKLLANWVGHSIPVSLVPMVLCFIAAVINIFGGSFVGVVAPALFPVVASVAHITGLNPILLYTCVTIGGLSTGISPFSAGGAMVLGFSQEEDRDSMFSKELFIGLPLCIGVAVVISIILPAIIR
jgi:di/tricarboxylate transporter